MSIWTQPLLGLPAILQLGMARTRFRRGRQRLLRQDAREAKIISIYETGLSPTTVDKEKHNSQLITKSFALPRWDGDLVEWIWRDISEEPADCIILTGHSMPLAIAGLLYKLTWGTMVFVRPRIESLAETDSLTPKSIDQLKLECHGLPPPDSLDTDDWNSLAIDYMQRFDGFIPDNDYIKSGKWIAYPRSQVDGAQLNCLESIAPELASPLMAARFWEWSHKRIDWNALAAKQRKQELVSIIIPVYGDSKELEQCLHSVRQTNSDRWDWEAVIVMNDESEQNCAVATHYCLQDSRIRLVWPGENTQFALGCNLGFAASEGQWLILLNNDCAVTEGWIDGLIDPLEDSAVAATQPRLIKPDGTIQSLGVVFHAEQTLGYPLYAGLSSTESCTLKPHHLHALTGACLAVRASDFAKARGLDCRYLNSQEDIDLCLRLLQQPGRKYCLSTPSSTVLHAGSRAPGRFGHSIWSRHQFVRRWMQRVPADDTQIYSRDGMTLEGFHSDHVGFSLAGIGAGRARVRSRERQGDLDADVS